MTRRRVLVGTVAAAAAAGGLGWQLWQQRGTSDVGDFWSRRFERPDGGELLLSSLRGRPLVVNFWATWCPPCVKEMPEIDRFHTAFVGKGWQVLGLAVDRPEPVRDFLARRPVGFHLALAGLEGTEISKLLGNERGLLPVTAIFDAQGRVVKRKLGETSFAELSAWASSL